MLDVRRQSGERSAGVLRGRRRDTLLRARERECFATDADPRECATSYSFYPKAIKLKLSSGDRFDPRDFSVTEKRHSMRRAARARGPRRDVVKTAAEYGTFLAERFQLETGNDRLRNRTPHQYTDTPSSQLLFVLRLPNLEAPRRRLRRVRRRHRVQLRRCAVPRDDVEAHAAGERQRRRALQRVQRVN